MQAIIYTTNTGSTQRYAQMLSQATGLPAYSLTQAGAQVPDGAAIIYMGWIAAGTVKGYAAHESQTFEAVTEARAKATSINLSADDLTPGKLAEFQQAQAQVRSALGRLIAVSESYPDLKANQNFLELQAQLEGTENRISVARKEFNEVAKTYNVAVRRFPANLVAKLFGFGQKPYFEAAEGTETAPRVQF